MSFRKNKELSISLQQDVHLKLGLDQNIARRKIENEYLPTCDSFSLIKLRIQIQIFIKALFWQITKETSYKYSFYVVMLLKIRD